MSVTGIELLDFVQEIVRDAKRLKDERTDAVNAPINYACVFAQSAEEYSHLLAVGQELGSTVQETATGPVIQISPLDTDAGKVRLLKLRAPDDSRPERGDADFTVPGFSAFKERFLGTPGFKLIQRPEMEMIELADAKFDVLVYFSHPPLEEVLGLS